MIGGIHINSIQEQLLNLRNQYDQYQFDDHEYSLFTKVSHRYHVFTVDQIQNPQIKAQMEHLKPAQFFDISDPIDVITVDQPTADQISHQIDQIIMQLVRDKRKEHQAHPVPNHYPWWY